MSSTPAAARTKTPEQIQSKRRNHRNAAGSTDRPRLSRADGELIPRHSQFRTIKREKFDSATEFKRTELVISEGDDEMFFHGVMLLHIDVYATAKEG